MCAIQIDLYFTKFTLLYLLQVDESSGTLRTIRRLDRERQSSYTLFITASDGPSSLPVTCQVSITVDDVNDNRPTMIFPSTDRSVVHLYSARGDLSRGSLVARLDASDPDEGPNAEIQYAVEYGNEEGLFEVDRDTGALTVAAEGGLDGSRPLYRLVVSASDRGDPPLRTVTDLEIRANGSRLLLPAGAWKILCRTSVVVSTLALFNRHSLRLLLGCVTES